MPSVDLICVYELFIELNILGIQVTNDPNFWGNNHGSLEMKKRE